MLRYALCLLATPALATDPAWPDLREEIFGTRTLQNGVDHIAIEAPYRTPNDLRTDIGAFVKAPTGLNVGKLWVILDENPMPVSAVFEFDQPLPAFYFNITMRVNQSTPVHVVLETTDSQLFVADAMVKTSGTGACSAPPGTDPELALATLGEMDLSVSSLPPADLMSGTDVQMDVDISHPSHSGMQKDQISLLFIPMRYLDNVDVDLNGQGYVGMTGSISLSENPTVSLSIPRSAQYADVTITDTDGTESKTHKDLGRY